MWLHFRSAVAVHALERQLDGPLCDGMLVEAFNGNRMSCFVLAGARERRPSLKAFLSGRTLC